MDAESLAQVQQIVTVAVENSAAEIKRHTGVLIEDLHHKLDLVVEGIQMHIEHRHAEERAHTDDQFRETRALIQLSYQQLHQYVRGLEHRIDRLEQRGGEST